MHGPPPLSRPDAFKPSYAHRNHCVQYAVPPEALDADADLHHRHVVGGLRGLECVPGAMSQLGGGSATAAAAH